jgi:hypothetical protein
MLYKFNHCGVITFLNVAHVIGSGKLRSCLFGIEFVPAEGSTSRRSGLGLYRLTLPFLTLTTIAQHFSRESRWKEARHSELSQNQRDDRRNRYQLVSEKVASPSCCNWWHHRPHLNQNRTRRHLLVGTCAVGHVSQSCSIVPL